MNGTKLIGLLKGLEKQEIRIFEQYISTPFFNINEKPIKLFNYIKKYYPDFISSKLEKEKILKNLFPDFKGNASKKLGYISSDLTKLLEGYFIWKEVQDSKKEEDYLLIKALKRRNLKEFSKNKIDLFRQDLDRQKERDTSYFYHHHNLNYLYFDQLSTVETTKAIDSFLSGIDYLDVFYFATKLKHAHTLNSIDRVVGVDNPKIVFIDEIKNIINEAPFNDISILHTYCSLYNMSTLLPDINGNEAERIKEYYELKDNVINNLSVYEERSQSELMLLLIKIAVQFRNAIGFDFRLELFNLYKFAVENNLLLINGFFLSITFYNIVSNACAISKIAWADQFIKSYKSLLPIEEKDNIYHLTAALVACQKKEFDTALELLQMVSFNHFFFSITTKYLTVRCYYESGEELLLSSFLDSYTAFIRRHTQMTTQRKNSLLQFASYLKKLMKYDYSKEIKKEELIKEIEENKVVAYKDWLKEMTLKLK